MNDALQYQIMVSSPLIRFACFPGFDVSVSRNDRFHFISRKLQFRSQLTLDASFGCMSLMAFNVNSNKMMSSGKQEYADSAYSSLSYGDKDIRTRWERGIPRMGICYTWVRGRGESLGRPGFVIFRRHWVRLLAMVRGTTSDGTTSGGPTSGGTTSRCPRIWYHMISCHIQNTLQHNCFQELQTRMWPTFGPVVRTLPQQGQNEDFKEPP